MNKNISLVFNVVLLALVGILFYFHFSSPKERNTARPAVVADNVPAGNFKIAYFEMDSIENNYEYLKDVKGQLKAKETELTGQLTALKNKYMEKVTKFQQEAQSLSQEKQSAMQNDLLNEQKMLQNKEQSMGAELQDESFKRLQVVNKAIEDYLQEYNKDKGYSYILGYQSGQIYYKDPKFDITAQVLAGLNERYKKKK